MKTDKDNTMIAVVEDEPAISEICQRVLTEERFEVDTASDGRTAHAMISSREYDSYFVDIRMPLMDGKELYESLQKKFPHIVARYSLPVAP